jgi:hypothetical protein
MTKDLGNVTNATEFVFEYKMKKVKDLLKMKDVDVEHLKCLPFQT